jgi:hypothetical protein
MCGVFEVPGLGAVKGKSTLRTGCSQGHTTGPGGPQAGFGSIWGVSQKELGPPPRPPVLREPPTRGRGRGRGRFFKLDVGLLPFEWRVAEKNGKPRMRHADKHQ